MAILANARHEKFVQCLLQEMSQRKAYLQAFPNAQKWKDNTVDVKAGQLFGEEKVGTRYRELLEETKDKGIMDSKERMIVLSQIAADEEEKTDTRMKAIDTLNKMEGEYAKKTEAAGAVVNPFAELSTAELKKLVDDG